MSIPAYANDGNPHSFLLLNNQNLRISAYEWKPQLTVDEAPRGAVLLIHGVTSHAKFEYLYHPLCGAMDEMWAKKKTQVLEALKAERPAIDDVESIESAPDSSDGSPSQPLDHIRSLHINPAGAETSVVDGVGLDKKEVPTLDKADYKLTYEGSWVESLNKENFVVFAVDLQSHGMSDGWNGNRCSVQMFDHFAQDVLLVVQHIRKAFPVETKIPLFLIGISMGGLVLLRTLEIGSSSGQFGTGYLTGAVLLAPALSVKKLKAKPGNKIGYPFAKFLSRALPAARVAAVQPNLRYYHIEQLCAMDPLIFKYKLRARLSVELMEKIDIAHEQVAAINPEIAVLICHSNHDTMCDPDGSKQLMDELKVVDRELWLLDDMWHFLTKEPGTKQLLTNIITWINKHIDKGVV